MAGREPARAAQERALSEDAILPRMDLLRPIYRQAINYGHFVGPELPREQ